MTSVTMLLLALVLLAVTSSGSAVDTQDESVNIKSQREQLREEMEAGNLMIGFQFVVPISEGDNYWLFGDPNDANNLTIQEIGDSHFCFSETSGQAVLFRCIPFTNIASFDYLGN